MVFQSKCKICSEFFKYRGKYCSMKCKLKRKDKILPTSYTMKNIIQCLENNIGVKINLAKVSKYSREIKKFL